MTITSFFFKNLMVTRKTDKDIKIGCLLKKIDADNIKQLKSINAQQICPSAELLTPQGVLLAKEHGLQVKA